MERLLRRRPTDERGETLLELIVSIVVLGLVVVSLGTGLVMTKLMSTIHRKQAVASDYLRNYAEVVQSAYQACSGSTAPNYVSVAALPTPSGFNAPTASVRFWNGAAFASSTCPATDPGLQQVTFTLVSTDSFVSESIVTIVRSSA